MEFIGCRAPWPGDEVIGYKIEVEDGFWHPAEWHIWFYESGWQHWEPRQIRTSLFFFFAN